MRILLALFLAAHALAHVPGFLAGWNLLKVPESPFKTTVLGGRVDLGLWGIRFVGVVWLATGVLMACAAYAVLRNTPDAYPLAWTAFGVSVAMTIVGWPDSKIGVLANGIVLVALILPLFAR